MIIGIVSQWYDPEPGPAATTGVLARALVSRGHEVHVVTGYPNYPIGKIAKGYKQSIRSRELLDGVHVVRVPLYASHDHSSVRRLINYLSFAVSSTIIGVPSLPKVDVLWVNFSPITVAIPMWLHKIFHKAPIICEVADLWPDTLDVSGVRGAGTTSRLTRWILDRWCRAAYRSSAAVVHISPSAGRVLHERGVPSDQLHYIPKSADEKVLHPRHVLSRSRLGISKDAVVLLYAGSMGTAQGLDALIHACDIEKESNFVLLMVGSGIQEKELRSLAKSLKVGNIQFLGRVDPGTMADLMGIADIAYIGLAPHATSSVTMPSKTQNILASGRAILSGTGGDLSDLVETHKVGFTACDGSVASIAIAIRMSIECGRDELRLMGHRARSLYESEFSEYLTAGRAEALMRRVIAVDPTVVRSEHSGTKGSE